MNILVDYINQSKILTYTFNGQNSVPSMLAPFNEANTSNSILLLNIPNYELFSIKLHVYTIKDDPH